MSKQADHQYTIRNIPRSVDAALKKRAHEQGKSLNTLLLEIIGRAVGARAEPRIYDDLDPLAGTWVRDPETEKALTEQRKIVKGDWEG